jgi:hypothetical protein
MRMHLDENPHRLFVYGTDPSRNIGATATVDVTVVDTELTVAPPEGAHRRSVEFEARSRVADRFECSLDGAPFDACALGSRGLSAPLSLPDFADGEHTLRVRGKSGDTVDLFPATRTFTIDTTAPETTIRATDGGFALGSDATGVTYRCRVDARPYEPCDATMTLAPGPHEVEAFATDRAGNADASPATLKWTLAAPAGGGGGSRAPGGNGGNGAPGGNGGNGGAGGIDALASGTGAPAATPRPASPAPRTQPKRIAFKLRYRYVKGRLTSLKAVGLPRGAKATVTVKCPKRSRCPKSPTTIARLVGKRLVPGTRIAVTAGATTRTITLPRSR